METVKCKALRAFTEFVSGYGMVHGDPNNRSDRVKFPLVPANVADRLATEGKIEATGGASLPQLDHDHDGHPGGSATAVGDDLPALRARYRELAGKNPFNGWDADELARRIAALDTDGDAPVA